MFSTSYFFQWQNPTLRKTIYPFREKKLKDFLLYYREIDLCREKGSGPVDPRISTGLIQEITRLETELSLAKVKKAEIEQSIKSLTLKHRALLSSEPVRKSAQKKVNLQIKFSELDSKRKTLERQVEWYRKFAPEHPYFDRWNNELQALLPLYEAARANLQAVVDEYNAAVAPFETETKALQAKSKELVTHTKELGEALKALPRLDAQGKVTPNAAIRWQIIQYDQELSRLDHDPLLEKVLERFDAEPQRFPKWLRYMIVHFSGMRYKSAHGSWADPRDLLEMLKMDGIREQVRTTDLNAACTQAITRLRQAKSAAGTPADAQNIEAQIQSLSNPATRQTALTKVLTAQGIADIRKMSDDEVLQRLKMMQSQFPGWMWKEIVSRTQLRLEVTQEDWESLTPPERSQRWNAENQHWREIMNFWEQKDITGWRKQHERTLSLIVSRAVCNEIAEHIQHLRGVKPAAGLAAKPVWYLNNQKAKPGQSYFKRPTSIADFKSGASILFLGWVDRKPNPWQIATPIAGIDLVPIPQRPKEVGKRYRGTQQSDPWKYAPSGGEFLRTAQVQTLGDPVRPGGKPRPVRRLVREWLRWTHEATIVEVARMADGRDYVLTFETGQIGLNLRSLGRLLNVWDIFVGYVPAGPADPPQVSEMLERDKLLPPRPFPPPSYEIPGPPPAEEPATAEDVERALARLRAHQRVLKLWQSLTRRQRKVAAMTCAGFTTRQIAKRLDLTSSTVRTHLSNAVQRFGLDSRSKLCPTLAILDLSPWLQAED